MQIFREWSPWEDRIFCFYLFLLHRPSSPFRHYLQDSVLKFQRWKISRFCWRACGFWATEGTTSHTLQKVHNETIYSKGFMVSAVTQITKTVIHKIWCSEAGPIRLKPNTLTPNKKVPCLQIRALTWKLSADGDCGEEAWKGDLHSSDSSTQPQNPPFRR